MYYTIDIDHGEIDVTLLPPTPTPTLFDTDPDLFFAFKFLRYVPNTFNGNVYAFLSSTPHQLFRLWQQYDQIEPISGGGERADLAASITSTNIANLHRDLRVMFGGVKDGAEERYTPVDFMPYTKARMVRLGIEDERVRDRKRKPIMEGDEDELRLIMDGEFDTGDELS